MLASGASQTQRAFTAVVVHDGFTGALESAGAGDSGILDAAGMRPAG